jgi:hypothetical protein
MTCERLPDDQVSIMKRSGATGTAQGHLGDLPENMTNALWTVAATQRPFMCNIDFYANHPEHGATGIDQPAADHPREPRTATGRQGRRAGRADHRV